MNDTRPHTLAHVCTPRGTCSRLQYLPEEKHDPRDFLKGDGEGQHLPGDTRRESASFGANQCLLNRPEEKKAEAGCPASVPSHRPLLPAVPHSLYLLPLNVFTRLFTVQATLTTPLPAGYSSERKHVSEETGNCLSLGVNVVVKVIFIPLCSLQCKHGVTDRLNNKIQRHLCLKLCKKGCPALNTSLFSSVIL